MVWQGWSEANLSSRALTLKRDFLSLVLMNKYLLQSLALSAFITIQIGCSSLAPLPKVANVFSSRGQAKLVIDKDYQGAIEDFTHAIEFDPHDANSYVGRGIAYQKIGNTKAAREDFEKAVSLNPELAQAVKPFR